MTNNPHQILHIDISHEKCDNDIVSTSYLVIS